MTYYEILEVSENASDEVIKASYKALVKKYHPDLSGSGNDFEEEKMKQLNVAFDVLSNEQKRKMYDDELSRKRKNIYTERGEKVAEKNENGTVTPEDDIDNDSPKRGCFICVLLLLAYTQAWHPYFEAGIYENHLFLGVINFLVVSMVLMVVPTLVGVINREITKEGIKKLCAINSVVVFCISLVLFCLGCFSGMFVGWIGAIIYYYLNKNVLLQVKRYEISTKKCIVFIILVMIVCGLLIVQNKLKKDNRPDFCVDIAGKVYDLRGSRNSVIARTIVCADEYTANLIYDEMKKVNFDEMEIINLMDKYGSAQGGGEGRIIRRGEYIENVVNWCLDDDRKEQDIAIIKSVEGYTICYISYIIR